MAFIFYFSKVEEFNRVIAKRKKKEGTFPYQKIIILPYAFTLHFTFIHLADTFIQEFFLMQLKMKSKFTITIISSFFSLLCPVYSKMMFR